ncbi:unnamed protein product [Bursaphelenchus okinawaensis]|uniref:Uncharacterized protein n=1 Tax=Bursaphelenchus okinawaensis TaxID=465554 RepID=A0A811JY40_9BILA|nr:unnamed protein product [Bursaphelenchus okinawaensis]CAG9086855.1 unnamed protein product [Bursaphelenchus okinawaensis]
MERYNDNPIYHGTIELTRSRKNVEIKIVGSEQKSCAQLRSELMSRALQVEGHLWLCDRLGSYHKNLPFSAHELPYPAVTHAFQVAFRQCEQEHRHWNKTQLLADGFQRFLQVLSR